MRIILLIGILLFSLSEPASSQERTAKNELLDFEVAGTVLESRLGESVAVIKNIRAKTQAAYKISDKILDYKVVNILRGRVALLRKGKIYYLDFPLGSVSEPITVISEDKRIIDRGALTKKIPSLNALMEQGMVIPHIESGKITGLKIAKIKDKALAKMAGLSEGDILTSVNGQRLNSLQGALEAYRNTREEEKIDLEIKRNNKNRKLTYYINQ